MGKERVAHQKNLGVDSICSLAWILQVSPITVLKKPLKVEQLNQAVKILGHNGRTAE
jgi:hypothetical protein